MTIVNVKSKWVIFSSFLSFSENLNFALQSKIELPVLQFTKFEKCLTVAAMVLGALQIPSRVFIQETQNFFELHIEGD